jgi:hypothetical protein
MACGWGCGDPTVDGSPQPAGSVVFFLQFLSTERALFSFLDLAWPFFLDPLVIFVVLKIKRPCVVTTARVVVSAVGHAPTASRARSSWRWAAMAPRSRL